MLACTATPRLPVGALCGPDVNLFMTGAPSLSEEIKPSDATAAFFPYLEHFIALHLVVFLTPRSQLDDAAERVCVRVI